jgi:anti-sigma B factor antagonist
MEITTTQYKRCDVLKAIGRIDGSNAHEVEKAFNDITEAGRYKIIFDMSEITFVASRGWWVLIGAQKACKRFNRGEVVLVNVQPEIRKSLDLVGMGDYFKSFDDVTSAVGYF